MYPKYVLKFCNIAFLSHFKYFYDDNLNFILYNVQCTFILK